MRTTRRHFVKFFGFTPMQAIVAATRGGGAIIIKHGALADLLLVDGDPASDIGNLKGADRLLAIMQGASFHEEPAARGHSTRTAVA